MGMCATPSSSQVPSRGTLVVLTPTTLSVGARQRGLVADERVLPSSDARNKTSFASRWGVELNANVVQFDGGRQYVLTHLDSNSLDSLVVAAIRSTAKGEIPVSIQPSHGFLADLGFDSMSISLLALALEDALDRPVLLDEWVASHSDPALLTVGSLCDYLRPLVVLGDQAAI